MKTRPLIICFLLISTQIMAKPKDKETKPPNNEIGLFITVLDNDYKNSYSTNLGLQYKHWVLPNLGYRVMGAIGAYTDYQPDEVLEIKNDTTKKRVTNTDFAMFFVGGGLETQYQISRRVYLYAALETKIGYGNGYRNTFLVTEASSVNDTIRNFYSEHTVTSSEYTTVWTVDAVPFVGAKLQLGKFLLGSELSGLALGITQTNYTGLQNSNLGGLTIKQFQHRFYINYRF